VAERPPFYNSAVYPGFFGMCRKPVYRGGVILGNANRQFRLGKSRLAENDGGYRVKTLTLAVLLMCGATAAFGQSSAPT
jgi:hypothetical protein